MAKAQEDKPDLVGLLIGGMVLDTKGSQPISVNAISGSEYLSLREAGWQISGAWMLPPNVTAAPELKKAQTSPAPPTTPPSKKKSAKAKSRPPKRAKHAPKQRKGPSPQKRVALSPESMARLKSADAFQLPKLAPNVPSKAQRASFTQHIASTKINWNDESEDGSMWNR